MTRRHFAEGQILFKEGDPPDCLFRLVSGTVEIFQELDGDTILLARSSLLARWASWGRRGERRCWLDRMRDYDRRLPVGCQFGGANLFKAVLDGADLAGAFLCEEFNS